MPLVEVDEKAVGDSIVIMASSDIPIQHESQAIKTSGNQDLESIMSQVKNEKGC
jgi:hypothetical protein